jgi:pimeloyl-ACP methyl ester carboxylesterase
MSAAGWSRPVVALIAIALAVSACGSSSSTSTPATSPSSATSTASTPTGPTSSSTGTATNAPIPKDLASFYHQKLDWTSCSDKAAGAQCAQLKVPLDYLHPAARSITLPVIKVPAKGSDPVGNLVVNPGGPGGSGVDMAAQASAYFTDPVLQAFNIVGFDPRGVGTINCVTDSQLDAFISANPEPMGAAEQDSSIAAQRRFDRGCFKLSPPGLAAHVSTVEAAKDMDVLRAALGDTTMDYYGASYGTKLGATYASLYPGRVGRFVLDGAVDPTLGSIASAISQAKGFELALHSYIQDCIDSGSCFLGDTVAQGEDRIQQLLTQIAQTPLSTSSGRQLTLGLAIYGIITPLYERSYWSVLSLALKQAIGGDGSLLLTLADAYSGRNTNGSYSNNLVEANLAISCLDFPLKKSREQILADQGRFTAASKIFGPFLVWSQASCDGYKAKGEFKPPVIKAAGAAPIVVIGTTRDPATPYSGAVDLAKALQSGVLVTRNGDGHTGYDKGNVCTDSAVEDYLIHGTVPKNGLVC